MITEGTWTAQLCGNPDEQDEPVVKQAPAADVILGQSSRRSSRRKRTQVQDERAPSKEVPVAVRTSNPRQRALREAVLVCAPEIVAITGKRQWFALCC
jgi:hypothetical protein